MADTNDYVAVYKRFFEDFAKTVDPDDQLPVKVAGYRVGEAEIVGEAVDWTLQYLSQRKCPPSLVAPITRIVIDEVKQACEAQPEDCGFRSSKNCYVPLKLMQAVTNKVNEVCLRFRDNGRVTTLPPPKPGPLTSSYAVKNSRRCMEDRHVVLDDLHAVYNINDCSCASYYAVFDGHAGTDAAMYSVSHLHQFLAESPFYPTDPVNALKDAFLRTDSVFIEKSKKEKLRSGTTAICALLRPKERKLYIAWLGDSQAVLVRQGKSIQLVEPHKPDRPDEMERISSMGGTVVFWGTWRVNGQLAVSRAIGDLLYKPYVTAEPDVRTIDLEGNEDFLILACDGLWDFVCKENATKAVFEQLLESPGDLEAVSQRLVRLAKTHGSTDNITIIVAFLTDPQQLVARELEPGAPRSWAPVVTEDPFAQIFMDSPPAVPANPFEADSPTAPPACPQKAPLLDFDERTCPQKGLLDFGERPSVVEAAPELPPSAFNNGHANGNGDIFAFLDRSANGREAAAADEDEDDDDSGSESGAEAKDGKAPATAPAVTTPLATSNPFGAEMELELELALASQQQEAGDPPAPRQETPTPPADDVPGIVSDNVAESGEESEDEWNYIQVKPTDNKTQRPVEPVVGEPLKQTNQPVCQEPLTLDTEEIDMESQLNPNAAEFVPSPTSSRPIMEEFLVAQSKDSMDDVVVPSNSEFQHEVSLRPSDLDFENSLLDTSSSKAVADTSICTSDLMNGKDKSDSGLLDFTSLNNEDFAQSAPGLSEALKVSLGNELSNMLDESGLSTKVHCGDESSNFSTNVSDFQKTGLSGMSLMEASLTESDFIASGFVPSPNTGDKESSGILAFQQENNSDIQKEPVHISFELQKEIAPKMESQPERVKVDSDEASPSEPEPELEFQPSQLVGRTLEGFVPSDTAPCEPVCTLPAPPCQSSFVIEPESPPSQKECDSQAFVGESPDIPQKVDTFSLVDVPSAESHLSISPLSSPEPQVVQQAEAGHGDTGQNVLFLSNQEPWRCEFPLPPDSDQKPDILQDMLAKTIQDHNDVQTPDYEKLEEELEALEAQEAKHVTSTVLKDSSEDMTSVIEEANTVTCEENIRNLGTVTESAMVNHEETVLGVSSEEAENVKEENAPVTSTPPPTPAPNTQAAETEPSNFAAGPDNLVQAVEKLAESKNLGEVPVSSTVPAEESAIVAAAAAAVAASATIAGATPEKKTVKKEVSPMKKQVPAKDKKPAAEKPKMTTKPSLATSRSIAAAKPKSPTSPLKPLSSTLVSKTSTVRKTTTATSVSAASPSTKTATSKTSSPSSTASSALSKPRPASSTATKPSGPRTTTSTTAAATTRPRPASAVTERKPLTNGDISKQVAKRPDQLATKTSTTRLGARPHSAPAAKPPTKTTPVPSTLSKTKTSSLNGPAKPKVSSAPSAHAKPGVKAVNEKEIKESANKQISSTRTSTTVRSTTATARMSHTTSTTTRKIETKPMANGRAGAATKPTTVARTAAKLPAKRPVGQTLAKTGKSAPSTEKSETVPESTTDNTTNEVKTEVLIENAQPSA